MLAKLVFNSVARSVSTWLALIISAIVMSVILTLNIGLVIAGTKCETEEAQNAFVAMGSGALMFTVLTGFMSLVLVVKICVGLQRKQVALWQVAGVLPSRATIILLAEVVVVSLVSAGLGAVVASFVWPAYGRFVWDSGLPQSEELLRPIASNSLLIGIIATSAVVLITGIKSSFKVVRSNVVESLSSDEFISVRRAKWRRVIRAIIAVLLILGLTAGYFGISSQPRITDARKLGDYMTIYMGTGIGVCIIFALVGTQIIHLITRLLGCLSFGNSWFMAAREASARPDLTSALVVPIVMMSASTGIMNLWIDKLMLVLNAQAGTAAAVNAPPQQMVILFGGPVLSACVCASSVVCATINQRTEDNAILLVSGSVQSDIYKKITVESVIYFIISCVCGYGIALINEVAINAALEAGPVPVSEFQMPGANPAYIVFAAVALSFVLLVAIAYSGLRKNPVAVISGGR